MKKLTSLLILFVTSLFILSSCSDDDNNSEKEIAIKEFTLKGEDTWKGQKTDETFQVIRTQKELENFIYISFADIAKGTYPDFSKSSVLLASGPTLSGVSKIDTKLIKTTETQYTLYIDVYTNVATVVEGYRVAVLTPNIEDNIKVIKSVTIH